MTSCCTESSLRDAHFDQELLSTCDVSWAGFYAPHLRSAARAGTLYGDENSTARVSCSCSRHPVAHRTSHRVRTDLPTPGGRSVFHHEYFMTTTTNQENQ